MEKEASILIGKVVGVHGIKGNIKIYTYTDSLSDFKTHGCIRLKKPGGGDEKSYDVKWAKPHKNTVLMSLEGIDSCDLAEELIGWGIFIKKTDLPELEEGVYYWIDIIGLSVFSIDDSYLGLVESIMPTGGNDVYVVKDSDKNQEILVPALETVVLDIDFERKRMLVDLPEGLQ